jgi:hypothetical protein
MDEAEFGLYPGRDLGIGHGEDILPHAEAIAEGPGDVREPLTVAEQVPPCDMDGPVLVADCDVLPEAHLLDLPVGGKRVVPQPPPGIGIEDAGKEVHDRVNVRGDVVAGDPDVFCGIYYDRDLVPVHYLLHAPQQLRRAGSARQKGDHA